MEDKTRTVPPEAETEPIEQPTPPPAVPAQAESADSSPPKDGPPRDGPGKDGPGKDVPGKDVPPRDPAEETKPRKKKAVFIILGLTLAAVFTVFYLIVNHNPISSWFKYVFAVVAPILVGISLAYLLNPAYMFFSFVVFKKVKHPRLRQTLSIILTYIWLFFIIWLIVMLIVPQFIASMTELISNLNQYATNTVNAVNSFLNWVYSSVSNIRGEPIEFIPPDLVSDTVSEFFSNTENLLTRIVKAVSDYRDQIISSGTAILSSIFTVAKNLIFGLFISIYLLATKDKRLAQIKKFNTALFSEKHCTRVHKIYVLTNRSFGGFINGKLLDSLIIGLLTLVVLLIFRFPYPALLATIIGVTNIIPIIGPFVGAIPAALLVLIVQPSLLIPFILIIIIIQQIDGNIIGPSILGDSVGVSSLCIIIVIIVMGSLFGLVGMLIGVPLFAVIIEIIKQYLEYRLRKKKKETSTVFYYPSDTYIDPVKDVDDRTDKIKLRFKASANRKRSQIQLREQNGLPVSRFDRFKLKAMDTLAGNRKLFGIQIDPVSHRLFDLPYESVNNLFEEELSEIPSDTASDISANEARNSPAVSGETPSLSTDAEEKIREQIQNMDSRVLEKTRKSKKKKNKKK
ncbi:MAG: AI-2E family transporter [Clostridia bacterium]|nr:AI-2E family transporter [Clostridia bacterium]